ncbi:hypothetical protein Ciccas_001570 [Cichlidogyrus casuarinus]|uniref:Uncharacterized protein n=1 Tax=Cichlidogyrus casuarinus TaxID=1844966 RepID=A0ABD2QJP9_9PLAT
MGINARMFGTRGNLTSKITGWPNAKTGGLALTDYLAKVDAEHATNRRVRAPESEPYLRVNSRGNIVMSVQPMDGNYSLI